MLLSSVAYAQEVAAGAAPSVVAQLAGYLPLVLVMGLFYFMVLRPQSQQAKKTAAFLDAVKKGDKVLVSGAFEAEFVKADGVWMHVKMGGADVRVLRGAVAEIPVSSEVSGEKKTK